ncbi:MAG: threonine synthase [Verrucomicrobia bacterium]|nr:threonine synthase [Verrucomicrobiota bacterium]
MKYISTRGLSDPQSFSDVVMTGLASDGGLFLPSAFPDFSARLDELAKLPYADLAVVILTPFVDLELPVLRALVEKSYSTFSHPAITPTVRVGDLFVLELFHGPTLAFKDLALQWLGHLFEHLLKVRGGELNIVGATSGDTGSAAIQGVRGRPGIRIFIMHPRGKVSRTQELQMTSVLDDNVYNMSVAGTFDDCQSILKALFNDLAFKQHYHLGAINSINWARVLAQVVYYFRSAFEVMRETGSSVVDFSVPTGNFGDIFAGYVARRMGLPIRRLVLATNENDILARFFNTGFYAMGDVHATLSPSMDIQIASNFERYLYYLMGEDPAALRWQMDLFAKSGSLSLPFSTHTDSLFRAGTGNRAETLATIKSVYARDGYLLDPHSAVGVHVAGQYLDADVPMICLATAHPAKFGAAIQQALGEDIAHHPALDALEGLPTRKVELSASLAGIRNYVETTIRDGSRRA